MDVDVDRVYRLTLEQYHQLIESGGFGEDMRVELIDGLLVDMRPKSREHENAVRWLNRWLVLACEGQPFESGAGSALTLTSQRSEPEPDLVVFPSDAPRPYHPGVAALVIEVAVSSLRYDLLIKSAVYALGGVAEYWVVDLDGRRVICHRDPDPEGVYRDVSEIAEDGQLTASSVELPALDVGELMAAAHA
jgi:Uma2 family endonuclease